MADGILITEGVGKVIATDEISSQHYQRVKLIHGEEGVSYGDVSISNGFPIAGAGASVQVTLTVTNGAYTVGDVVGGLITFAGAVRANGKKSIINSIKLAGVNAIPYELWFIDADLATPVSDNGVFSLVSGDLSKILAIVPISAADYFAPQNSFNVASIGGVGKQVKAGSLTSTIYAYMKATAVTSPGTTTLILTIDFEYLD